MPVWRSFPETMTLREARTRRRGVDMGARTKLNQAFFNGSLLLACAAGVVTGSWLAFGLALAALVAVHVLAGEIRPRQRRR